MGLSRIQFEGWVKAWDRSEPHVPLERSSIYQNNVQNFINNDNPWVLEDTTRADMMVYVEVVI